MGKKIVRSLIIALLLTGIFVLIIGASIALPTFDPSKLNVEYKESTIFDRNDQPIMSFQATPGDPAKLNEIPVDLQHALVAVEDTRFYEHNGIDIKSIGRAVYRDILTGSAAEGGSTLTQQLAKNVYLTHEKTLTRKVKEIYLAAQIERNYSKEDILEMYFNRVYFGNGATGIKMAAETYFGKGDKMGELTLGEMALLAGLPNAPSAYNPYVNMDLAVKRRNIVLDAMERDGYITTEQRVAAEGEKVNLAFKDAEVKGDNKKFPYYLDYILEEAENKLGIPAEQVLRGGVKVYTNLDPKIQDYLEKAYADPKNFPQNAADGTWAQGASVILDPKTGGIMALIGGRDQNNEHALRGFNRASMAKVRPGSTFKPIIDYAPAIDMGVINSKSPLNNKQTTFPGGYAPRNWNDKYSATVPVDEALTWSLNVPAVSLLEKIGIDKGWEYATQNFGIPLADDQKTGLGIALGSVDVSPLDLAGAYTAFANDGVRTTPHAIRKVLNDEDKVIGEINTETHQAISSDTAKVMTKLMKNVIDKGTGTAAKLSDRDVAGKTGTQEMDGIRSGNRSAWFAGYTPEYLMVTWMGFDNTDAQHYLRQGSEIPAALFKKVMGQSLQGVKGSRFDTSVKEKEPEKQPEDEDKKTNAIVKDLAAKANGKQVQLTWSAVDLEGARYVLYRAEKQADGTATNSTDLGEMAKPGYVDTGVQAGKTYLYNVGVYKDGEKVSDSNYTEVTMPGTAKPDTPKEPEDPKQDDSNEQKPTEPATPTQPGNGKPTEPTTPPTGTPTPKPTEPTIPPATDTGGAPQPGGGTDGGGTGGNNGNDVPTGGNTEQPATVGQ